MTNPTTETTFASALAAHRSGEPIIVPHVVGGQKRFDGALFEREDPSDPRRIVTGAHEAPDDLVQLAVDTSRAAQREWERVPVAKRAGHVRRGIDYLIEHTEDWTLRIALEIGKAHHPGVMEAKEVLQFLYKYPDYAELPGAFEEEDLEATDLLVESVLRPYGVFAIITPFNYPIALAAGPAIAAVLAGNGVVIKTAPEAPWSGQAAYELFEAMGLPTGLVNVVHGGDGPGRALVASDADGISFVGSAEAGASIVRQVAAGPYLRPVIAEMGGKNPVIVTDTADLEAAADGIAFSAFDVAGQKCSGVSRVLVTPGVRERLTQLVAQRAKDIQMDDPANPDAYAGPLVSKSAVERYERVVKQARDAGFTVAGGERIDDNSYLVRPAVVYPVPEDHELARTEHFLPLVTISEVASFEEALKAANDVPLGLTAGVYTGDRGEAREFLQRIEAGCVNVNVPGHATTGWWPGNHTFGGWKGSASTGKQAYGKWYVAQFAREQARKLSPELRELLAD
jgi:1-pyrroline-5-carboxylate dehydrogenase